MKNPINTILFFLFLYFVTYLLIYLIQFVYYEFNFWVCFIVNLLLLWLIVYFIDICVKKIDAND